MKSLFEESFYVHLWSLPKFSSKMKTLFAKTQKTLVCKNLENSETWELSVCKKSRKLRNFETLVCKNSEHIPKL